MVFAAGARDSLGFERHDLQIVGKAATGGDWVKTCGKFRVLRGDASGVFALVPVIISAGRGA
ncbi:hypothetical protein D3C78_1965610 [compost metagenome]